MSQCPSCGKTVSDDGAYCPYCGEKMTASEGAARPGAVTLREEPPDPARKKWPYILILCLAAVAAAALVMLLLPRLTGSGETPSDAYSLSSASRSVLYLEMHDRNGTVFATASGFLVEDGKTLVTAFHAVRDARYVTAWTPDGKRSARAEVLLAFDEAADLAVLSLSGSMGDPLRPGDSDAAEQGHTVYAIGYPLGVAHTMSNGIVSAKYRDDAGVNILQVTAAVSPGNSGGPLVDEAGCVLGVISANLTGGQNLNLAVAVSELRELLARPREPIELDRWKDAAFSGDLTPLERKLQTEKALQRWLSRHGSKESGGRLRYEEIVTEGDMTQTCYVSCEGKGDPGDLEVGLIRCKGKDTYHLSVCFHPGSFRFDVRLLTQRGAQTVVDGQRGSISARTFQKSNFYLRFENAPSAELEQAASNLAADLLMDALSFLDLVLEAVGEEEGAGFSLAGLGFDKL